MPQNATYFSSFLIHLKYPLLLKTDWYKDGCHLQHIFWGRQVSLSLCLSLILNPVIVCSVSIHDACFNLYLQQVNNMTL